MTDISKEDFNRILHGWAQDVQAAVDNELKRLREENELLKTEKEWRPIETVPIHTWVLVCGVFWGIARKDKSGNWLSDGGLFVEEGQGQPSHWLPLPPKP